MKYDDKNNYYLKREYNCLTKIETLLLDMPVMAKEFILGITEYTSPLTRLNYTYDLRIFFDYVVKTKVKNKIAEELDYCDLEILTITDFEMFLAYLSKYSFMGKTIMCSEKGKARKLSTVRAFYTYLFNKDKIKFNTASKISTPKIHNKEIIRLEKNEVINLLDCVDSGNNLSQRQKSYHNNTRVRDIAILTLFLGTGIRISELVGLNVDQINMETNSFVVTRKGGNRTILYFNEEVKNAIENYILERNSNKQLNASEKALFISLQNKRISVRTVEELVKKYAKVVSPLKHITPHKLRSTFGTNLYQKTGDIYLVADFLGHTDVNTTKKHYAAMSENLRKNAVKSIKLKDDND